MQLMNRTKREVVRISGNVDGGQNESSQCKKYFLLSFQGQNAFTEIKLNLSGIHNNSLRASKYPKEFHKGLTNIQLPLSNQAGI